ncbi:Uncharacterized protein FKW44_012864 [Caligus rogercresseyi]|uniref:Uncharacterized protein n=1 Tax=Caligus rogercresseyi TaxID=217165 RepID=A0A7T8HKB7_CALRO|nr:Uncharacterized protein FKW44_012864 [Caligus rogercresseyi]
MVLGVVVSNGKKCLASFSNPGRRFTRRPTTRSSGTEGQLPGGKLCVDAGWYSITRQTCARSSALPTCLIFGQMTCGPPPRRI